MRLLAAVRLAASGSARNFASASSRAPKSSGDTGRAGAHRVEHLGGDVGDAAGARRCRGNRRAGARPCSPTLRSAAAGFWHGLQRDSARVTSARRSRSMLLLDEDAQRTDGGAAQAERILGAAGFLADGEDAGQRVELVGQRHGDAGAGGRQRAAGAARHVVLVDGGGDFGGLAIGRGVVAPHDSLQFGEFADHRGQQVALGQLGGARRPASRRRRCSSAISPASVATRRTLSPIEPSFAWKVTASSAGKPRGQRLLAILAPEERRVRQARPHHALVAGAHLGGIAALDVADGDEMRAVSFAVDAPSHREISLVMLQRGDQHLARQLEETRLETAGDGARPFDQRGDLVEQRIARAAPRRPATCASRDHLFADQLAARGEVRDHLARSRSAASYSAGCASGEFAAAP